MATEEVNKLMAEDLLPSTSTITEHPICECGQQMTRFVNINTRVRAVKIKTHCDFCGFYKYEPWEIVEEPNDEDSSRLFYGQI
jgi:hypothetical protein